MFRWTDGLPWVEPKATPSRPEVMKAGSSPEAASVSFATWQA